MASSKKNKHASLGRRVSTSEGETDSNPSSFSDREKRKKGKSGQEFFLTKILKKACGKCLERFNFIPRMLLSIKTINALLVVLLLALSLFALLIFLCILLFVLFQTKIFNTIEGTLFDVIGRTRTRLSMTSTTMSTMTAHFLHDTENIFSFDFTTDVLYKVFRNLVISKVDFPFIYMYTGKFNGETNLMGRELSLDGYGNIVLHRLVHVYNYDNIKHKEGYDIETTAEIADIINNEELAYVPGSAVNNTIIAQDADPWVANAMLSCAQRWTPAYTDRFHPEQTFITLTQTICDTHMAHSSNKTTPLAYLAIDETIFTISGFLKDCSLTRGAIVYFVEIQSERLVGVSDRRMISAKINPDKTPAPQIVTEDEDPMIRDSSAWIKQVHDGSFATIPSGYLTRGFYFGILLQPMYIGYYRFSEMPGLDWLMVLNVPFVVNNMEIFIGVPFALIGIVIVLCFASITFFCVDMCMFKSLSITIIQAKKVEIMDLDNKIFKKSKSMFTEIATVQKSFEKMVAMLKEFKPFIPQFVLAKAQQFEKISKKNKKKSKKKRKSNNIKRSISQRVAPDYSETISNGGDFTTNNTFNFGHKPGHRNSNPKAGDPFSLGFKSKFVTIVHCKIANLNSELRRTRSGFEPTEFERRLTVKELEEQHTKVMELFMSAGSAIAGIPVLVTFGNFSMMIMGDNSTKQSEKALAFVMRIQKKMLELNRKFELRGQTAFQIHIGIAQSDCLCGNVGSSASKHFSVVGTAVDQSRTLSKAVKRVFKSAMRSQKENKSGLEHTMVLVTSPIFQEMRKSYSFRSLGAWESKDETFGCYYLLKERELNGDSEWMNETDMGPMFSLLDDGFAAIMESNFEKAERLYSLFLNQMMNTPSSKASGLADLSREHPEQIGMMDCDDDLGALLKFLIDTRQPKLVVKGMAFSDGTARQELIYSHNYNDPKHPLAVLGGSENNSFGGKLQLNEEELPTNL